MKRLRKILDALRSADAIGAAGIACLAVGAWMAWPPAGLLSLGAFLILAARTEAR